jgi:hypothetical protein
MNAMTQQHPLDTLTDCLQAMWTASQMLVVLNRDGRPHYNEVRMALIKFITEKDREAQQARIELDPPYMEGELTIASQRGRGVITTLEYWQQWMVLFADSKSE